MRLTVAMVNRLIVRANVMRLIRATVVVRRLIPTRGLRDRHLIGPGGRVMKLIGRAVVMRLTGAVVGRLRVRSEGRGELLVGGGGGRGGGGGCRGGGATGTGAGRLCVRGRVAGRGVVEMGGRVVKGRGRPPPVLGARAAVLRVGWGGRPDCRTLKQPKNKSLVKYLTKNYKISNTNIYFKTRRILLT